MKRIILAVICIFVASFAQAQTDQGTILLSGGLGLAGGKIKTETFQGDSLSTDEGPSTTGFSFSAMPGFFVSDYLALGLGLGYTSQSATTTPALNTSLKMTESMLQVVPTLRYYAEMGKDLYFLAQFQVGFGFGSMNMETTTGSTTVANTNKTSMFMAGITPGFSYMFSETISFDVQFGFLGYEQLVLKTDLPTAGEYIKDITSEFGIQGSLTDLKFGISIHI